MARNPIPPPPEYVSPAGRPIWIDHKALVLTIEPRAYCCDTQDYGFVVYEFEERGYTFPEEEARIIGTGRTAQDAWRDAHLYLTEPEECTCAKSHGN